MRKCADDAVSAEKYRWRQHRELLGGSPFSSTLDDHMNTHEIIEEAPRQWLARRGNKIGSSRRSFADSESVVLCPVFVSTPGLAEKPDAGANRAAPFQDGARNAND
jgi:hypothetical protein